MTVLSMPVSQAASRAPDRGLALVRFLAMALAVALLALVFRPAAHLYDMPMTEDGYYALSAARNVAAGNGITIDGTTLTNGFQPLFTFLEAGAFWLAAGDEVLAMRLVALLGWLFHGAGALVLAAIARDAWPAREEREREWRGALAAFLYLASPLVMGHAYNGLETGCVLFFWALAWRIVQIDLDRSWGGLALFGAVIGLMVLARIDTAFLALVLGLYELHRARGRGIVVMLARGAVLGGVALAVSSPWWIYNTLYFGSPMPTSGTAQQAFGLEWLRIEFADWALRLVAFPWIFAGAHEGFLSFDLPWPLGPAGHVTVTATGLARTLFLALAVWLVWRAWRRGSLAADLARSPAEERARVRRSLRFLACAGVAMAGLVAYYAFTFVAYWFYYRYFAPIAAASTVAAALLWARLALRGRHGAWFPALNAAVALLLAAQLGTLAVLAQTGRGIGGNTVYHDQVALAREFVPDDAEVAAGQTGTLGFFRQRVVNLDGKVNRDALAWQGNMWEYLRRRDVRWFIDWPFYVNKYLGVPVDPQTDRPAPEANGWRLLTERNYFYVYRYVGEGGR